MYIRGPSKILILIKMIYMESFVEELWVEIKDDAGIVIKNTVYAIIMIMFWSLKNSDDSLHKHH